MATTGDGKTYYDPRENSRQDPQFYFLSSLNRGSEEVFKMYSKSKVGSDRSPRKCSCENCSCGKKSESEMGDCC